MVSSSWKCINHVSYWGWVVTEPGKWDTTSQQNKRTWLNTHTTSHLTLTRDVSFCRLRDWESIYKLLCFIGRFQTGWYTLAVSKLVDTLSGTRQHDFQELVHPEDLDLWRETSIEFWKSFIVVTLRPILFFILPDDFCNFTALIFY